MLYMEYFDEVPEKKPSWLLLKLGGGGPARISFGNFSKVKNFPQ